MEITQEPTATWQIRKRGQAPIPVAQRQRHAAGRIVRDCPACSGGTGVFIASLSRASCSEFWNFHGRFLRALLLECIWQCRISIGAVASLDYRAVKLSRRARDSDVAGGWVNVSGTCRLGAMK